MHGGTITNPAPIDQSGAKSYSAPPGSVGGDDRSDPGLDVCFRQRAECDVALARGRLEYPGGLAGHTEGGENRPVGVVNVGESQAVAADEVVDFGAGAVPADTNDLDLAGPFLADRLDRVGFTVAGDSIWRPEPEGHRGPCVAGTEVSVRRGRRDSHGRRGRRSHINGNVGGDGVLCACRKSQQPRRY